MSRIVSLIVMLILVPVAVGAQQNAPPASTIDPGETTETNRAPIIPFLEGTDVFWTLLQRDKRDTAIVGVPNLLEANIFPHLVFYQTFTDVLDLAEQERRIRAGLRPKSVGRVFSGTPAVRVRMLPLRSAPVRTPSFMPRGNFQFLWVRGIEEGQPLVDTPSERARAFIAQLLATPRISIWEAHVIGGHHSNGQEGCLSTEQRVEPPPPADNGDCVPPGVVPTPETINRVDGSFASQFFFRFGGNYSVNWIRELPRPPAPSAAPAAGQPAPPPQPMRVELEAYREARVSAEYEWHPRPWVDPQMREIYGRHRLHGGAAYAVRGPHFCKKRLEYSGEVIWNPGAVELPDSQLDLSGWVQVSCFFSTNGGWGLFARFYDGQDYYNVGFLDEIRRFHVGVTFNQADFFRFRRAPAPETAPNTR